MAATTIWGSQSHKIGGHCPRMPPEVTGLSTGHLKGNFCEYAVLQESHSYIHFVTEQGKPE